MEKPVPCKVRNYQKGDEFALAKIFSECFGPTTPRQVLQWYRRGDVRPENIFIGVVDGKLVSNVEVVFKQLHHGEGAYLKTAGIAAVCTDSDYRKKGLVTNLLKLILDYAQRNGVSNASLFTGLDFPAHRIYQRLGFVDILTWRSYVKYIDYRSVFARWVRDLNRSLKASKIAARKLEGWEKSVAMQLEGVGTLSFRFRRGRFQKLKKPPKRVNIQFSTDLQTYEKVMRGVFPWEDAVKSKKLTVRRGEPAEIEMLKRIWHWRWDD